MREDGSGRSIVAASGGLFGCVWLFKPRPGKVSISRVQNLGGFRFQVLVIEIGFVILFYGS